MSNLAIAMNVTLTVMALCALGLGVLIACRLKAAQPGGEGRADGRGPRLLAQRIAASIATAANSSAR